MVNYKGHLFAFRVPFIQAVTSLQAQINEDQHPLAIRCRRLTFSSTKVACSPRSSHHPLLPFSVSPSVKFRFRAVVRRSSYTRRPFNDRSPNLLANRFFEESFRMEVVLARITRLDLLSFVNQWLRQFPPTNRSSAFHHVIHPSTWFLRFHRSVSLLLNCSLLFATFNQF